VLLLAASLCAALSAAPPAIEAPPPGGLWSVALPEVFDKPEPEGLLDLKAMEEHITALVERLKLATVSVLVGGAQGSGVIVSQDGLVLTAGHVSGRPGAKVVVILHDGRRVEGISLGRDVTLDSGLLKITTEGRWPAALMGSSSSLREGAWCITLGHPGGYQRARGVVVRVGRIVAANERVIRTDCPLVGGDSGGPLFDMQGRVIGIHSRIAGPLTANFHVPIDVYHKGWQQLLASEETGRQQPTPVIGITGADDPQGCKIVTVADDLPAKKAGLQPGDIITHVDDEAISGLNDLIDYLARRKVGDKVALRYLRNGEPHTVELQLASGMR
jgi:serine protease Do